MTTLLTSDNIRNVINYYTEKFGGNGKDNNPLVSDNNIFTYNILEEIGTSGTKIFSGIISEEYLVEWRNLTKRCEIIERMTKSDATVKAAILIYLLPLMSADWQISIDENADDDDKRITDVARDMFFEEMTLTWKEFIRQTLSFLGYGFSMFEKVMIRDKKKNIIKIKKLAPRLQKTLSKWLVDEEGGLAGIEQGAYRTVGKKVDGKWSSETTYKTKQIPIDKMVIFTHEKEGSNFEGTSLLRSAYKHWLIKDKLYLIQAIGLERHALGIPVIYVGKGVTPAVIEAAKNTVKTWRAHREAGNVFPMDQVKVDSVVTPMQFQALDRGILHHDTEIAKSVLAQFIQLGTGSGTGGSWALSRDHSDYLLMSLNSIADLLADFFNRYIIRPWIELNWGERKHYSKLSCGEITKISNLDSLDALGQFINFGIIKPDSKLEEWGRKKFVLPERDPQAQLEEEMSQITDKYPDLFNQQQAIDEQNLEKENAPDGQVPEGEVEVDTNTGSSISKQKNKKYFDMGVNTKVKETLDKLIKLREDIDFNYKLDDNAFNIDDIVSSAYKTVLRTRLPIMVAELKRRYDIKASDNDLISLYKPALDNSKESISKGFKTYLATTQQQGKPDLDRTAQTIKSNKFSDDIKSYIFYDDPYANPELAALEAEQYNQNHQQYGGKAPIVKDKRTGKWKYAKGAVVDGQHVGGQWAPIIEKGIGGGLVIAAAFTALNQMGKYAVVHNVKSFWGNAPKSSWFKDLAFKLTSIDYNHEYGPGKTGFTHYVPYSDQPISLSSFWTKDHGKAIMNAGERTNSDLIDTLKDEGYHYSSDWSKDYEIVRWDGKNRGKSLGKIWDVLEKGKNNPSKNPSSAKVYKAFLNHGLHGEVPDRVGFGGQPKQTTNTIDEIINIGKRLKSGDIKNEVDAGNTTFKALTKMPNSFLKWTALGFVMTTSVILARDIWNLASRKVATIMRDVSVHSTGRVISPEEEEMRAMEYDRIRRSHSPTGGAVGRPRVNPELPDEIKGRPGRPSKDQEKENKERLKKKQEYISQWRQENLGNSQQYSESNIYKFGGRQEILRILRKIGERTISSAAGALIAYPFIKHVYDGKRRKKKYN